MGATVLRTGLPPWAAVPYGILEHKDLSITARLISAWIIGKPLGWTFHVTHIQKSLGISRDRWATAKKELQLAGAIIQKRSPGKRGRFDWTIEFNPAPLLRDAIAEFSSDGEPSNLVEDFNHKSFQKTKAASKADGSLSPKPLKRSSGFDIDYMKRIHIGFTLNHLGIGWDEEGSYVYWGDYSRARKDKESGHWVWLTVDGQGEVEARGSAIDLIAHERGCSTAAAINELRQIVDEGLQSSETKRSASC